MPDFSTLFLPSKGQPIEYDGRTVMMMHRYSMPPSGRIEISIVSTSSRWRQGIKLSTAGHFLIADQKIAKGLFLWEDTMHPVVVIEVHSKDGVLCVSNAWDTGDGVAHSWHHGAALYAELQPDGRTLYYCNDGEPDDDFDDIIFSIRPAA
ncbi:MAG TPA: hypothetical protein VNU68_30675 [Verrucomicrobiae bacterium]|nr:hypothetical protein [Verrucomicrobiae bacterium]